MSRESGSKGDEIEETDRGQQKLISMGEDNTVGVGTHSYASPEQLNRKDYDSSSDVYSLGIILFDTGATGIKNLSVDNIYFSKE